MTSAHRVGVQVGLAGGVVFFLHALIPYSRSYPFIWPLVTGAVTAWRATADVSPHRARQGMQAVLVAGAVLGLVVAVGAVITVFTIRRSITDTVGPLGGAGVLAATSLGMLLVALIAMVATWLAGAVVIPFRARGHAATA